MVDLVLGLPGLTVISHAEAARYQGFVNATHRVLILVGVTVEEYRLKLLAVTIIHASVRMMCNVLLFCLLLPNI